MNDSTPQRSPSSVASRRALYEKSNLSTTGNTKRPVVHSDSSDTSFPVRNSPFLRRKFDVPRSPVFHKRNASDSKSSKSDDSTSEDRFHPTVDTFPVFDDNDAAAAKRSPSSSQLTKEQERIARLNEKFAEVRYLLKTNQIRPLDSDPPSFVPTPPPNKVARKNAEVSQAFVDPPKLKNALSSSDILNAGDSGGHLKEPVNVLQYPASFPSNISSISGLLPTDTLNRPHLGLSYSMEDDLSPGVKEILTSTPKSDRSMVGLSTFSQSVSSLGYGSGQSDLDLNVSLKEENKKIPISTLKSQTLPIGMKLGPPFSYITDIDYDCDIVGPEERKIEAKVLVKCEEENGHHRSSSAPPMKHLQRKNIFGMSRKSPKEDKNKKDDNISMKSDISFDERMLFRKFVNIDGSTENQDLPGRKQPSTFSEEKTKRKSVWKSILRRK